MSDSIDPAVTNQHDDDWMFPLILSFMAGASTCLGAAIVFCFDSKQIEQTMTFSLSLAASVMITVSVISIGPECLEDVFSMQDARHVTVDLILLGERLLSCGAGCFGYWLLSKALAAFPEPETLFVKSSSPMKKNTRQDTEVSKSETVSLIRRSTTDSLSTNSNSNMEQSSSSNARTPRSSPTNTGNSEMLSRRTPSKFMDDLEEGLQDDNYEAKKTKEEASSKKRSWRVAMLLFFSLLFHNFPEGLAVVASTVESRQLGVTVAIGILIHNIPEGIAIAVPCIAARPDLPWLAFWLASGSGLAEPLGAVFALMFLQTSQLRMENVLACVGGIMCTVAALELYPEALRHVPTNGDSKKDYRQLIYGTLVGMIIMIATEWYLV